MTSRVQSETVAGSGTSAYTYAVSTDPTEGYNYPDGINTWSVKETQAEGALGYSGQTTDAWPSPGGIAVGGSTDSYTLTDEDADGVDQSSIISTWGNGTVLTFTNAATGGVIATFTIYSEQSLFHKYQCRGHAS